MLPSGFDPKPEFREIFFEIWAVAKLDANPAKFGQRAALGVTAEISKFRLAAGGDAC